MDGQDGPASGCVVEGGLQWALGVRSLAPTLRSPLLSTTIVPLRAGLVRIVAAFDHWGEGLAMVGGEIVVLLLAGCRVLDLGWNVPG
jgi:hypothetical protein